MIVDNDGIINYLLYRNLISRERIVDCDLVIIDMSRRNCNFKVISKNSPSYFLKQEIRNRNSRQRDVASVAYEAEVYHLLNQGSSANGLSHYLPHYYSYDEEEHMLILEGIDGAISLTDYHLKHARFSCGIAKELGKALAILHRQSQAERTITGDFLNISQKPPWIFFLPDPDQWIYFNSSAANIEFVKIIQQSEELRSSFAGLREQWKATALIHGDLKWDNCLITLSASPAIPGIKIIDWELACMGDPCWDVACLFSEYLKCWLSSIPISSGAPPDQFLSLTGFPLTKMQPAMRSFWGAYLKQRRMKQDEGANLLPLISKYIAVRLVQIAFEQLQTEAAITTTSICLLQLSLNMLARPIEAAVQLLGLPISMECYQGDLLS